MAAKGVPGLWQRFAAASLVANEAGVLVSEACTLLTAVLIRRAVRGY